LLGNSSWSQKQRVLGGLGLLVGQPVEPVYPASLACSRCGVGRQQELLFSDPDFSGQANGGGVALRGLRQGLCRPHPLGEQCDAHGCGAYQRQRYRAARLAHGLLDQRYRWKRLTSLGGGGDFGHSGAEARG
jgi:hypothetical protein